MLAADCKIFRHHGGADEGSGIGVEGGGGKQEIGDATDCRTPDRDTFILLKGVAVTRPNQVWSTDITYIRLPRGFVYLVTG